MWFPVSSTGFYHYVDKLRLESLPFPYPLTPTAGSTVIDLWGETHYAETLDDLPPLFHEVAAAYGRALEDGAKFSDLKAAIRDRDPGRVKAIWDPIARDWDERTFYDFVASSAAASPRCCGRRRGRCTGPGTATTRSRAGSTRSLYLMPRSDR